MRYLAGTVLGVMLLISSCSQSQVATQRDSNVNTQHYQTYRWINQDDAKYLKLRDPNTDQPVQAWVDIVRRPETETRVRKIVEKDLNQFGYTEQYEGQPDFFVTFYSLGRDQVWTSSWSGMTLAFQGAPLVIYPDFDMHKALEFRPGMGYVVIYDAKTKRPAWTGTVINAVGPKGEVDAPVVTARIGELIGDFKNTA